MRMQLRLRHMLTGLLMSSAVIMWSGWIESHAGKSLYTYVDERGNMVATDRLEDIPLRYRDRVKVAEHAGGTPASRETISLPVPSMSLSKESVLYTVIDWFPARVIPGLSTYQSVMLIGGFLAMVLFYGAGKLTGGSFWRLLMPWAVGIIAVATLYFMFLSELSNKVAERYPTKSTGSLLNRFQAKSQDLSEQKQQRLKRFDQRSGQE